MVLDEAFDKADNEFTALAMNIFKNFGFQMIVATPLKSVMTLEPFIGGACFIDISERRWRKLGAQPVPEKLRLADPGAVARWIGETERWDRASRRYRHLLGRWPRLGRRLPRYFAVLADYSEADYRRLLDTLAWIDQHPACGLYPRQLPVSGLDSKEQEPHAAQTLPLLTDPERAVYRGIKSHTWGQNVRLEQERIAWDVAWKTVQQVI